VQYSEIFLPAIYTDAAQPGRCAMKPSNVGGRCLIVLATAAEFTDGMFTVQPDPDQADLIDGIPETEAA
jgi:hypothetical protein